MSDRKKTFHEIALESILFKGQYDWYFCFVKAEKIGHVLAMLSDKLSYTNRGWFYTLVDQAAELPSHVAYFAAGDMSIEIVLAHVFSLISDVRMSASRGYLSKDTALYIVAEYEKIAEKLAAANKPSPFVSPQDFSVPEFLERPQPPQPLSLEGMETVPFNPPTPPRLIPRPPLTASSLPENASDGIGERAGKILNFVLQNKAVSIREVCAILPDCSEKTIQRELAGLIERGLIRREGERRWSVYKPL